MFLTWWTCGNCPYCSSPNWLHHGDMNDLTGYEPVALKCWKCGKVTVLDDLAASLSYPGDYYAEKGKKTPQE